MQIPFRIRTGYFVQIVAGGKNSEVRRVSTYWTKIVNHAQQELAAGHRVIGVFVCGKRVHRREVLKITIFGKPELALGRPPSEQGRNDLGYGPVYKFSLGHDVECKFLDSLQLPPDSSRSISAAR